LNEDFLREVAAQLRKPSGEFGNEVAENMNLSNRAMNMGAIEALSIQHDETILEIGMANGAFVPEILSRGDRVNYVGVDYSADMVELAAIQNKAHIENGYVEFLLGEISQLPVSPNSIDKIFTVNTIYFWESSKIAIEEVRRTLKPGGLFIIAFRPEGCIRKYPSTQFNFEYFDIHSVEKLMKEHGFELFPSIHKTEPEMEILGEMIIPEHAIVIGKKTT